MSREITIHIGPRDPKDEDRLLIVVMREAQPGDIVTVTMHTDANPALSSASAAAGPSEPKETLRVDDEAAHRVSEGLNASLEKDNEQRDQAEAGGAVKEPEAQAAEIAQTTRATSKSWRQMVNEAGWKVAIEAVLKTAWEQREKFWEMVREQS